MQTDHVLVTPDAPTGVALIAVGPTARTRSQWRPARTMHSSRADVVDALETLEPDVLLVSLEIPERDGACGRRDGPTITA